MLAITKCSSLGNAFNLQLGRHYVALAYECSSLGNAFNLQLVWRYLVHPVKCSSLGNAFNLQHEEQVECRRLSVAA